MTVYKNIESRRNGTDLTFESRRNGSRRNGSRQNGSRRNGSRRNGNIQLPMSWDANIQLPVVAFICFVV